MAWEVKKLGDVCEIELGKTPYRGDKSFWDPEKQTTNVWLSIADLLKGQGKIVADSKEYVSDKGAKSSKIVKKGTLLVSFKLTLGRLAFAGRDLFTNEAIAALAIKNEVTLSNQYLYYFLTFFDWDTATKGDVKVKGKTLNKAKLKQIDIILPSLPEQKRIVTILDEAFESIAKAKENAEKNLKNAKEIFESYLQSLFENKGEGWEEKTLGSLSKFVSVGYVGPTSKFYCEKQDGIPFLRSQNVRPAKLSMKGIRYILPEFHTKLKKSQLKSGDLLFVRVGANRGDCCSLPENLGEINCANIVFSRPTEASSKFLELFCLSQIGRERLLGMTTGSAQGVINTKSVAELRVPLPNIKEQLAIEKKFNLISAETKRLKAIYEKKLADLEELKKSILQKAFEGALK